MQGRSGRRPGPIFSQCGLDAKIGGLAEQTLLVRMKADHLGQVLGRLSFPEKLLMSHAQLRTWTRSSFIGALQSARPAGGNDIALQFRRLDRMTIHLRAWPGHLDPTTCVRPTGVTKGVQSTHGEPCQYAFELSQAS